MKKFIPTTLIALLISSAVFSQTKNEPVKNPSEGTTVNQASNSQLMLLSPANGISFTSNEASKPVMFRWTAVVPKPKEAVTYRLKVWQLMQDQNGIEAMKTNQPIVTKDVVNITQAAISNLYTGPCKPPYLCDFIWAVEVLNSEGGLITHSNAGGNGYSFKFEKTNPTKAEANNKGNAGNTGLATGKRLKANGDPIQADVKPGASEKRNIKSPENTKSLNANGDPIHGVDIKLGMKSLDKGREGMLEALESIDKEIENIKAALKSLDKGREGMVGVGALENPDKGKEDMVEALKSLYKGREGMIEALKNLDKGREGMTEALQSLDKGREVMVGKY